MRFAIRCLSFALLFAVAGSPALRAGEKPTMLSHDVYFTLKDDSPKKKEALVDGCKKFLSKNPGTVWFSAGAIVAEHQREVNDRDFHVALHIVFKDKASHDKYQNADAHHKFIEEYQDNWKSVRVFDSWLTATAHGEDEEHDSHEHAAHDHSHAEADHDHAHVEADHDHDHGHAEAGHDHGHAERDAGPDRPARELKLPDPAARFAGMIEGKVAAQKDRGIVLSVTKVLKTWRGSKAKDPQALQGKKVLVIVKPEGKYGQRLQKFVRSLKVGEEVELDVAHREGEVLVLVELTEQQRRRVAE